MQLDLLRLHNIDFVGANNFDALIKLHVFIEELKVRTLTSVTKLSNCHLASQTDSVIHLKIKL